MIDNVSPDTSLGATRRTPDDLLAELSVPSKLGLKPGLERVQALLSGLGDPHRGLPVVHVGGTSGKGSTATILDSILRAAGYHTGLHAKPHLQSVEERFVVGGDPIAPADLAELLERAATAARQVRPTWHELTTAAMLSYFRERAVDLAVVEVGLGGTYDSTNVVEPLVAVLTNVGLDHTEVLGDTVEEIANDKVGIVKPGCAVVTGARQPSVVEIVERRCAEVGSNLHRLEREIRYDLRGSSADGSTFDLTALGRQLSGLRIRLIGRHQVENAAVAVGAALALEPHGYSVDERAIREGLEAAAVPGRAEILQTRPTLILDGAHNPDKMAAFAAALREDFRWRRLIGVLAFKRGHDHAATLGALTPLLDSAYLTRFTASTDFGPNAAQETDSLAALWPSLAPRSDLVVEPDPVRAVEAALAEAAPEDVVCVTGSLYLVGQVRGWFRGQVGR